MEFNHSIPKPKHIHKTIPSLLFTAALLLCTALITPLTVHADSSSTEVEAEYSDGTVASSGGKWYATYCPTAGYKGQGVLLYLLERNGGGPVAGTTPKAYPCSATMLTYELHAQDKYNRYPEVTTWESTPVYWKDGAGKAQGGGFMKDSITSNTTAIKQWLKTPKGDGTNGIAMVQSIWGPDIATRFTNEEIILIAEPIVAVQFAQYYESEILKFEKGYDSEIEMRKDISRLITSVNKLDDTVFSPDLINLLDECIGLLDDVIMGLYYGPIATDVVYEVIDKLNQLNVHTNIYYPLGDTYAGTPKMVASYYASLSPDQSVMGYTPDNPWRKSDSGRAYYRKSANAAAYIPQGSIICSNANFNLLPATIPARQIHSDSNLQTYSIGMLAMLAFTSEDGQTTCDESLIPTEHPAPDESDGDYTIIKSYRTRNTTTNTLQDRGTYPRSNLSSQITIEDEDTYKVIAWKTSTQLNSSINSLTWETSIPGIIGDQGTSSTSLTLPSSQKYLYVLLEKPDNPTPATTNYTLTQSSITRHIYLSHPDAQLTMPQIQSHTFTWYIPAHPEGTCGGHPYNFHCGHSHNSNCYTDELDCTNTSPTHTHTDSCYDTQLDCNHSCNNDCAWDTAYCTWGQWTNTDLTVTRRIIVPTYCSFTAK